MLLSCSFETTSAMPIDREYPSFVSYCIFSSRSLLYVFILCYFIFLMCVFLYSFAISFIRPVMNFNSSNHSPLDNLCVHLHLTIKREIEAVDTFLDTMKDGKIKKCLKFIWNKLNVVIIPHVKLSKYDIGNAGDDIYVAFYALFIVLPIAIIIINPIRFATSDVIDEWIASCIYSGDFKSYNSNELYSIVNDNIKYSLPSVIRSFFIIIGIIILLYVISKDVVVLLNEYIQLVVNQILKAKDLVDSFKETNNEFLTELKKRMQKCTDEKMPYTLSYVKLSDGHEKFKTDTLVKFFEDSYDTFTAKGSLIDQTSETLTITLSNYSSDFRVKLFAVAFAVFVLLFLVFFVEEVYLPSAIEEEHNDMSAFLDLAETFKNNFKHNFLKNFYESRKKHAGFNISKMFFVIVNFLIKFKVVIILVIIFIIGKLMFDNYLGDFVTEIRKRFADLIIIGESMPNHICGNLEISSSSSIRKINQSEEFVLRMIVPAVIDVTEILLECFTEKAKAGFAPILNDIIAGGVAKFSEDFKANFQQEIFRKIFGTISFIFGSVYEKFSSSTQVTQDRIDGMRNELSNAFGEESTNIHILIDVLNCLLENNTGIKEIRIFKILNELMVSKFKGANKDDVKQMMLDFKIKMDAYREKKKTFLSEKIDRIMEIVYPDDRGNEFKKKYAVYNLLLSDIRQKLNNSGAMNSDLAAIFISEAMIPDFDGFNVFDNVLNICNNLISLVYSNVNAEECGQFVINIVGDIISMLKNATIVFYNSINVYENKLNDKNEHENTDIQKNYVKEFVEKSHTIYSDGQKLFNTLLNQKNIRLIITDISTRVGVIVGLIFGVLFFILFLQEVLHMYNSIQKAMRVMGLIKLSNKANIYFDESNVDSVEMVIIDFKDGINIGRNIGSYNILAKGLQVYIDLRDDNVGFIYKYNGIIRRIDLSDNLFISIIGDSGAGKSVVLNLLSLSDLDLLNNSVNRGEIRCCLNLKDGSKVNVPVSCVDVQFVQKYLNLLSMKQDQPYDLNEYVSTIINKYSGNTALENRLSLPNVEVLSVFNKCCKSILTDLGIWEIYSSKIQRKISEISGGQRQRFGISAIFANLLGNAIDFDVVKNLSKLHGKLSKANVEIADIDCCNSIIKNIIHRSFVYNDDVIKVYIKQLKEISKKLMEMKASGCDDYYIAHIKAVVMDLIILLQKRDGINVGRYGDGLIKVYMLDESLSALNNAVKDNVMQFIDDILGVNKKKYPTIENSLILMVEHGSISIKHANLVIVCALEDSNNSFAACGTFYEVLHDERVPLVFKSQILEARLEEILSSSFVSDDDKASILNIYKNIQSGTIVNDDWNNLPCIELLDTSKSKVVHGELFTLYLGEFRVINPMYDMSSQSIRLVDDSYARLV